MDRLTKVIALCAYLVAFAQPARAGGREIFLARHAPDSIDFDGETGDWPEAGYPSLELSGGEVAEGREGWEGDEDMRVKAYFAYDDHSLYIALKASDDKHVRTRKFEQDEDHVEVWVKEPSAGEGTDRVIAYYAGRSFPTFRGGVRWLDPSTGNSKPIKGARFYEESEKKGWEAELVIPWKAMPEVWKKLPATMWAFAAIDCDNFHVRTRESILATSWSGGEPEMRNPSVEEIENTAGAFLEDVGGNPPHVLRQYADVAGDGREEVIMQAGGKFAIFGHGFREGQGYVYIELPVASPGDIEIMDLKDLTGDGRMEIVFRYSQAGEGWRRKIFALYGFRGEEVGRMFAQDLERKVGGKIASSNVEILDGVMEGSSLVKVTAGEVRGWTNETFNLETEMDVQGLLLPWMEETTAYYLYRQGGFEKAETAAVEKYLSSPKKKKKRKTP